MAKGPIRVETLTHDIDRPNIPSAELEPLMADEDRRPLRVEYDRRNPDLDPQLIWRGKTLDDGPLEVPAPPIYLQEQVHPKALIEDLKAGRAQADDLFSHFGVEDDDLEAQVEFYEHSMRWSNRMILGDSLQVMASLAEREGLRGKVQCIYLDPPYGIRFNSNFQWSTTSRDVKDGNLEHLTREPEQVKAFRDTWREGIHSYLSYLRDRLIAARDLLTESGSVFVQIGDENVHRVRAVMDEVFGEDNFVSQIPFSKTSGATSNVLAATADYLIWYSKSRESVKYRRIVTEVDPIPNPKERYVCVETADGEIIDLSIKQKTGEAERPAGRVLRLRPTDSQDETPDSSIPVVLVGREHFPPRGRHWSVTARKMSTVVRAGYAVRACLRSGIPSALAV